MYFCIGIKQYYQRLTLDENTIILLFCSISFLGFSQETYSNRVQKRVQLKMHSV